jgi:hypothetical protein
MKNFKKQYRDLEMQILSELREIVNNSSYISKHVKEKAIKVNLFDYQELTIINDRLTFLDSNGYHYPVFTDASLEDLIDILNS